RTGSRAVATDRCRTGSSPCCTSIRRCGGSAAGELGCTLLEKCGDALAAVIARECGNEELALERESCMQWSVHGGRNGPLRESQRHGGVARDRARQLERAHAQVGILDEHVDEADRVRIIR